MGFSKSPPNIWKADYLVLLRSASKQTRRKPTNPLIRAAPEDPESGVLTAQGKSRKQDEPSIQSNRGRWESPLPATRAADPTPGRRDGPPRRNNLGVAPRRRWKKARGGACGGAGSGPGRGGRRREQSGELERASGAPGPGRAGCSVETENWAGPYPKPNGKPGPSSPPQPLAFFSFLY